MSREIPFVVLKWRRLNETKENKKFSSDHVNTVLTMLKKTQSRPFRLICITDEPNNLDSAIEVFPIAGRGREIIDEYGGQFFKLFLFSNEFRKSIGKKFVFSDLDVAVLGDFADLYDSTKHLTIMEGRLGPFFSRIQRIHGAPLPHP